MRSVYMSWMLCVALFCLASPEALGEGHSNYVKRSSAALALTADGATLLVVNPDSDSLSLIQLAPTPTVVEIAVGDDPRTVAVDDAGTRAYVANRASSNVSVVDLNQQQVIADIPVGGRPYGVVVSPDAARLYVAAQGHDRLDIIDTASLDIVQSVALSDRPSGLALWNDGRTLLITHLFRNALTVLTVDPYRIFLPLVRGGASSVTQPTTLASPTPISTTIPLWLSSNLVQSIVIAPNGKRAYVPHTRSNSSNPALTLDSTVFPVVSVIDLPTCQHLVGQQFDLATLDPPSVGLPFDAAFTPDGAELWIANAASNDVTVIGVNTRQRVAHIEVGDNPRGIVLALDGLTAYVNNTLAGTVSVIDTATYTVTGVITSTAIPLSPTLLTGKRLFNSSDDPRMGRDQWMSCNTCHFDGEHDRQTWRLGFAGPRNTSSLLGLSQTYPPLRWSGEWDEAADSEFAIRMDSFGAGLVDGPMNCSLTPPDCVNQPPHAGLSPDLDALAAYLESLTMPLHPDHANGEPLSADELAGQALFLSPVIVCAGCHPPPLYTDNLKHDVGTATPDERIGPDFNTPSLRGLYDSEPYFHDGSAATLYAALVRLTPGGEHDVSGVLTEIEIQQLIAFLRALPFEP